MSPAKDKNESRKTIDSFLDKYKGILNEEKENYANTGLFFDGQFIDILRHEADEIRKLCIELNNDPHFIQSLNLVFSSSNVSADGFKAEHLMISDIIRAYNQVAISENEKSRFTLAFFFDSIQGKDITKGISIARLNQMASNESFLKNIEKIKSARFIQTNPEYNDEYLMPSVLFRMQHPSFMKAGNSIYRFASIVAKADGTVNEKEKQELKSVLQKTAQPKVKTTGVSSNSIPEGDSFEAVMAELDLLIGLEEVKKSIRELANLLKIQKIRTEQGLANIDIGLHAVFIGPPGTGKTTIARLLGRLYKHLGYLQKGHLVETDRAGMVAGYVGQTAIKVNEIVNESKDGVLFIDEAYSLTPQDGGRDFGSEAVDTLIKRMEDMRSQLVVVVAGYTEPMKLFVESNPGLRSRFNRFFMFEHFLPVQLMQIFESFCKKSDFLLTDDAKDKLFTSFEMLYEKRDEGFGNARVIRNLFERCVQTQANRIVSIPEITKTILQTLEEQDIPEPKSTVDQVYFTKS
jgi:SpoVK/Ycf46/Vps4 family AAA+-type ATPase